MRAEPRQDSGSAPGHGDPYASVKSELRFCAYCGVAFEWPDGYHGDSCPGCKRALDAEARVKQLEGERDKLKITADAWAYGLKEMHDKAEKAERERDAAEDSARSAINDFEEMCHNWHKDELRAEKAERALGEMREALETICEIGETRDVEVARDALCFEEASDE